MIYTQTWITLTICSYNVWCTIHFHNGIPFRKESQIIYSNFETPESRKSLISIWSLFGKISVDKLIEGLGAI